MNDNDMRINTDRAQTALSLKMLSDEYNIVTRARYDLTDSRIPIELYSTKHDGYGCEKIHIPEDAAVKAAYQNFLDELIRCYEKRIEECIAGIRRNVKTEQHRGNSKYIVEE